MEFHNLSEHSEELTRAVPFCTFSFKTHTLSQQSKPVSQIRVVLKINSYITDCTKEWKISQEIRHESKKINPHNTFLLYTFLYFWSLIIPSGPLASLSVSLTGFSELALFSLWQGGVYNLKFSCLSENLISGVTSQYSPNLDRFEGRCGGPVGEVWPLTWTRYQLRLSETSARRPTWLGLSLRAWLYRPFPLYPGPVDVPTCAGAHHLIEWKFWSRRSKGTGRKREPVFLTGSLVMLMLLVHGLHLELQGLTRVVLRVCYQEDHQQQHPWEPVRNAHS